MSSALTAPSLVDGRGFRLRHIHPTARFPSQGATATILGRSYGFTELPVTHIPSGETFVEGAYTGRLGDSGEFTVTFPNAASAVGLWRERFSSDLAGEFLEIYRDDVLEFVGCIERVEIDRGMVVVSGRDAWALLRRAFERDRTWTAAPQEVATAYTAVPVALYADGFDGGTIDPGWSGLNGATLAQSGGKVRITGTGVDLQGMQRNFVPSGDRWEATATFDLATTGVTDTQIGLATYTSGGAFINRLTTNGGQATIAGTAQGQAISIQPPNPADLLPVSMTLRRVGRWIYGYLNGLLVGVISTTGSVVGRIAVIGVGNYSVGAGFVDVGSFMLKEHQLLLSRGSDQGKYVLPGAQPPGGLRGRYFNLADMQGGTATGRQLLAFSPGRPGAYGERLDPVIDTSGGLTLPLQPGSGGDYFAVRWFGAIYLRLDQGNYGFELTTVDDVARLWVGKTRLGDEVVTNWSLGTGTFTGTVTASALGGDAGWYPIVLEYLNDTGAKTIRLQFTPPAGGYTDPGGTVIAASTKRVVPATSLSPLGCFDNRVQGTSHFDLVQQAAASFGYQLTCEPMQLESGEFPGRVVPRLRVGRDTDVIIQADDTDGVEPALNPGVTLDGSDQTVNLIATGAGAADGTGGQTLAEVADTANLTAGLFALEAWVDAGDIANRQLLAARVNAELALRSNVWEEVRATPRAQERLADTWPLTSALAAMRWRPGDGLRIVVPDIGVEDLTPRQMIQVTRSFAPEGRTGTQVAFRQRPRSAANTLRGQVRSGLALGRSYQRQRVTLPSPFIDSSVGTIPAAGFTRYSQVTLYPTDEVVRAYIRIALNSANQSLGVEINGTSRTTALGGGWSTVPVEIDFTGYASQASPTDNRIYARVQNNGASSTAIEWQFIVEVRR